MYYTERKPDNKKQGRPGNEAISSLFVCVFFTIPKHLATQAGGWDDDINWDSVWALLS